MNKNRRLGLINSIYLNQLIKTILAWPPLGIPLEEEMNTL